MMLETEVDEHRKSRPQGDPKREPAQRFLELYDMRFAVKYTRVQCCLGSPGNGIFPSST